MAFVAVAIGGAAAVSLGTGIAGTMAQSDAANKASEIQAQQYAETKAALNQGKTEALGYIDPYAKAGGQALNELAYGMGLQTPTAGYTSQNTQQGGLANYGQDQYSKDPAYTPMVNSLAQLQATPGYQFQLEQGLQGIKLPALLCNACACCACLDTCGFGCRISLH